MAHDAAQDARPAAPADPDLRASRAARGDRAAPAADQVVVMQGVSRSFDHRRVVEGIDLTVLRGTILGIIGPSAAGKTW